jgi:hypothetical protein
MSPYRSGDLVELRYDAEHGVGRVFEVAEVRGDGSLRLRQRGVPATVFVGVTADDIAEEVIHARHEVLHQLRGA